MRHHARGMFNMNKKILPNLELKRFGLGGGWVTITDQYVSITIPGMFSPQDSQGNPTIDIDPELAPLFRMIAKRLDRIKKSKSDE